jgi:hypothetical protein
MISVNYQALCIGILIILIIGIIIGVSISKPKERERKIFAEVSEKELGQLGKYIQIDGAKQPTLDLTKSKLPTVINLGDFQIKDDGSIEWTKHKDQ